MRIQEAAKASGLPADTIRFYERQGVVPPPPRRENGYRHYTAEHVATLGLAKGLRQLGVPLDDIVLILTVAHDGTCSQVRGTMIETFSMVLCDLDLQMSELGRVRSQLAAILEGLTRMRPADTAVPGVRGCDCVRMVTGNNPPS